MSSNDQEVGVAVTAETDGAVRAVDDLRKEFTEFAKDMKEHSADISEKLNIVGEKFKMVKEAITAIAAGGSFAEVIKEANEFVEASFKMSEVLGITTEKATEQAVGLRLVGMEAERYTGLLQRMTLQVRNNEARLNALGVSTRDTSGEFKDSQVIMQSALKTLDSYKAGTDRNLVATELFGRNWASVLPLLRLNDEMMKKAAKDTEELGLAVSKTAVEDMHKFQVSTAEVSLVLEGVGKVIYEQMLPRLIKMGTWFREEGPSVIDKTRVAFKALAEIVMALINTYQTLTVAQLMLMDELRVFVEGVGRLAKNLATLDWKGMKEGFAKTIEEMKIIAAQGAQQIKDIWTDAASPAKGGAEEKETGDKRYSGKDKGGASKMQKWKEELEQIHLANDNLLKDTTEDDLKFWESKLDHLKKGSKEYIAVEQQTYTLKKKLAQDEQANAQADEQQQLADTRASKADKVKVIDEWVAHQKEVYGEDSLQYKQALREKSNADREYQAFLIQLETEQIAREAQHKVAILNAASEIAKGKEQLGEITALELAQVEQQNAAQVYDIQRKALQAKLALLEKDKLDTKETKDELGKLEDDYNTKIIINANKVRVEVRKQWDTLLSAVTTAFETSIKGMIMGTITFRKAMQNMGQAILGEFVNLGVKMVKDWVTRELAKSAATEAGVATRLAAEEAGQSAGLLNMVMTLGKAIMNDAVKTFSGVWAALSGIPYVGPALAAAAAPAAMATVAGMASGLMSAEGGYDIPSGINPMVQTHAREMILPSSLADKIRNMTDSGGGSDFHYHDHTGNLSDSTIQRNARKIAKAMNMQVRQFYRGT